MPVEITYQLTQDDFRHGMQAWRTRTAWLRWNYRIGVAVMITLLVIGICLLVSTPSLQLKYMSWFALGFPAVWFACVWAAPRFQARMQFRRMPSAQSPMTLSISDSEIHFRSQHYDSRVAWSTYIGWAEGDIVFVLFPQPRLCLPIPKRAFTGEQLVQFRELLGRKIKAPSD
jgi:hypothetical protein